MLICPFFSLIYFLWYLLIGSKHLGYVHAELLQIRPTAWAKSKNLQTNLSKTREMAVVRSNKASRATEASVTGGK